MGVIAEPVYTVDVVKEFDGRFCESERLWTKKNVRICLAHLDEGRVFECWCSSIEDAKKSHGVCAHKCEDARAVNID